MLLKEFSKPITVKTLNENLAKRFGKQVNVSAFTNEQLEDARNKLRTELSQVETNESFESVNKNDTYQKNKMFLDVINAEIAVREATQEKMPLKAEVMKCVKNGMSEADICEKYKGCDQGKIKLMASSCMKEYKQMESKYMKEGKMPSKAHVKKMCKDGKSEAQMLKMHPEADKDKLKAMIKDCKKELKESIMREGAEEEATLVMASKDMVDRITGWMEDTAEMQTESMLELGDKIRDELGIDKSEEFIGAVKPALEALYSTLEGTRDSLTTGVAVLTGEGAPQTMGDELPADDAEMDMEPTVDAEDEAEAPEGQDEFAAADASAGGEEPEGREKRESVELSKRLGLLLADSKKKA
tara:strand:+ start:930 stop:1997 length:1068 start_codon:yes stop_codon:yes gene_type:complete